MENKTNKDRWTPEEVEVCFLGERPYLSHQLATWFFNEWPETYIDYNINNIEETEADLVKTSLNIGRVPFTLVALAKKNNKTKKEEEEEDKTEVASRVLGSVSLDDEDLQICPHLSPWVACMYVAPQYRGKGVASILLNEMNKRAQALGVKALYLWTWQSLVGMYERFGWRVYEHTTYKDEPIVVMKREFI
jgi:GNAT superfamily N-acetyltransferase